jgi:two-component system chemotaxis response regulator CheY
MATAKRVLVVDDDESTRDLIAAFLLDEGFEVVTAVDGADALDRLTEAPVDLVLTDMRMPVMGGSEFMAAYRAQPGPHVPVVVMAASKLGLAAAEAHAPAGAIAKPFDLEHLLAVLSSVLEQSAD